ncbi:MAG: hypothetical protein JO055_01010 [Alphaproteobacteria bacterium]|nr:hypothetical protein [Alphaproteobacteria bacterium]
MALTATNFGISNSAWNAAKAEARSAMVEVARKGKTLSYGGLASKIHTLQFEARDIRLFHLLGEISREEDAGGRGMLSAVVVRQEDGKPGPGFFDLALSIGHNASDQMAFWVSEFEKVTKYWKTH